MKQVLQSVNGGTAAIVFLSNLIACLLRALLPSAEVFCATWMIYSGGLIMTQAPYVSIVSIFLCSMQFHIMTGLCRLKHEWTLEVQCPNEPSRVTSTEVPYEISLMHFNAMVVFMDENPDITKHNINYGILHDHHFVPDDLHQLHGSYNSRWRGVQHWVAVFIGFAYSDSLAHKKFSKQLAAW